MSEEAASRDAVIRYPSLGVMIEVPSALFILPEMAPLIDFWSVGSNDLTQYLLAVDRNNSRVANIYDAFHPAVIRALQLLVDATELAARTPAVDTLLNAVGCGRELFAFMRQSFSSAEQGARAFSSGCIRVEHADDLAELLLADSRYQPDKVASILKETQTKWLPLTTPIPVFTVYWSSWIDEEGRQQLRNDIYGFDRVSFQSRLL